MPGLCLLVAFSRAIATTPFFTATEFGMPPRPVISPIFGIADGGPPIVRPLASRMSTRARTAAFTVKMRFETGS